MRSSRLPNDMVSWNRFNAATRSLTFPPSGPRPAHRSEGRCYPEKPVGSPRNPVSPSRLARHVRAILPGIDRPAPRRSPHAMTRTDRSGSTLRRHLVVLTPDPVGRAGLTGLVDQAAVPPDGERLGGRR